MRKISAIITFFSLLPVFQSHSAEQLPYGTRTRAYSGYSATVRGDNENVGMAGATVAIPYSVSTLESNPAGLTMTMGNVTAQINSNEMEDRTISSTKTTYSQWGLTVTPNDWGYALAYYVPSAEEGRYISPNNGGEADYEVRLRQFRLSASRLLMKKRLSLGASVELNHATRSLSEESHTAAKLSYKVGAMYHVRNHYVVGASFSPGLEIGGRASSTHPDLPGFDQPIRTPPYLNIGAGWIPNRYFRLGFAVVAVGKTRDTALLRDQSIATGTRNTLQPRVGASYIMAQYQHLKITAAAGLYYERSRNQGQPNRIHTTAAVNINPWFVNLGVGVDRAHKYNNLFVSVGVDIVRTFRTFDLIPKETVPPLGGFWPEPFKMEADGLPAPITSGEKKKYQDASVKDVGEIIQAIPKNIENKLNGKPTILPKPKKTKKKRKKTL